MEYSIKEDKINAVLTSVNLETKIDGGNIEVVMGDGAKINTNDALTYIKSGEVEIENAVNAGKVEVSQEVHKANIWAEGTDAEVQALGGVHSSKGWAEESKDPLKWGNISGTLSNQTDLQNALNAKQDTLTFDNIPTQGSDKPVKSGGVYTSLSGKQNTLTFDDVPEQWSDHPVKSGGLYTVLSNKADLDGNNNFTGGNTIKILYLMKRDTNFNGGELFFQGADNEPNANKEVFIQRYNGCLKFIGWDSSNNETIALTLDFQNKTATFGTSSVTCPTPSLSDDTQKPATTEYINDKFVVVNSLPASPDPDVFYFIPEV